MEPLQETIDLDIDESNELAFKIKMEGAATSPAKVRLVCEGKDFSYMFNGYGTTEPDEVQFTLPQMTSRLPEGTYPARVEVLVENRYFAPLQFQINFKKTLTVVAEAIQVRPRASIPELKVTAVPIAPRQTAAPPIVFEQKPVTPPPPPPVAVAPAPRPSLREAHESSVGKKASSVDSERLAEARRQLRSKIGK